MQHGQIQSIKRDLIIPGDNDRTVFDSTALQQLAESIRQDGLTQPITVRPVSFCPQCSRREIQPFACSCDTELQARYEIVAGERRFRACSLLGMDEIPAIVRTLDDEQAAAIMLLENIQRVDINPIDEARAYQKRMQLGWSLAKLSEQTKVAPTRIASRLGLLKLIPAAQKLVADGQLALKFAQLLAPASGQVLDAHRQYIALGYLNQRENPSLSEFKLVLAELWEEQRLETDTLFNLDGFLQKAKEGKLKTKFMRTWDADDSLPIMPRKQSVFAAFQEYMQTLLEHGRVSEASVVGRVLESMIITGWVAPPAEQ